MKWILLLILFTGYSAFGQDTKKETEPSDSLILIDIKPTECYFEVKEAEAKFPGGQNAMYKFLSDSLTPVIHLYQNQEFISYGKIYIQFTIDTIGSTQDIRVIKGLTPELDQIIVETIQKMPDWTPGKNHLGHLTKNTLTLPINITFE